jgi:serine/threonine protein kinase
MLHLTIIEHGHNLYILLPYARYGDLELFLHCGIIGRERKYDFDEYFPDVRNGDVTHDLLRQCWSLANALEWLHNGIPNEKTSNTIFCVHMDFKPANILIQSDPDSKVGKWMISDFGISVLKEEAKPHGPEIGTVGDYATQLTVNTMNTRPKRSRGTYQAPEVQTTCNQPSHLTPSQKGIGRKSDIWSYGCIFSEVLAFALGRDTYVKEFHVRRKGREGDNYFYIEKADQEHLRAPNDVPNQYQVHPSVLTWLDGLCRDQSWVHCWAETIKNILIVDTSKRPNATELARLVHRIKEHADRAQVTLREDPIAMRHKNPNPPLDYIESPGDNDRDSITGDSDDSDTPSETPNGSLGAHPLNPITSVEPHGIMIYPDVRRIPNKPIAKELQRPDGSDLKATSVALTYSGGEAYAACLSKSSISFYKLDVEEMSTTRAFQPLKLSPTDGWQGIAVGGFFLAAWGYSSNRMVNLILYRLLSFNSNNLCSCTCVISVALNPFNARQVFPPTI